MDARICELIDKYLRKEMSAEECLNFEQEALNNPELRKEIELTCRIKRCLADRQRKLYKMAHWENKKEYKLAISATVTFIAAMLVVGFFLTKSMPEAGTNNNPIGLASVSTTYELEKMGDEAIGVVRKSLAEGKEEVAIAEVTRLEEQNVIPSLNDVSSGRFVMSHTLKREDADILSKDAYELHWLKIKSLIIIGKKEEALELLKSFVKIEGKYKATADSLLHKNELTPNSSE